jgi:hypothetical protein
MRRVYGDPVVALLMMEMAIVSWKVIAMKRQHKYSARGAVLESSYRGNKYETWKKWESTDQIGRR